jgi:protoporphyrinogen oxidase
LPISAIFKTAKKKTSMSTKNKPRVAVIGAGISGIMAAITLQEKGYFVKIFEKKPRIGGKSYTKRIKVDDSFHAIDLGTSVVAISFQNILKYARLLKEPLFTPTPYQVLEKNGRIVNLKDIYLPIKKRWKLAFQLFRYWKHVSYFHQKYMTQTGYASYIPERYQLPFAEYCRQNKMQDLCECFDLPIAAWGYTHQETIPTWYAFGEMDAKATLSLLFTLIYGKSAFVKSFRHGYGRLLQRIALYHNLDIEYHTEIQKIQRNSNQVQIHSGQQIDVFDYVILSDPAILKTIEKPSSHELEILNKLEYAPYATALCMIKENIPAKLIVKDHLKKTNSIRLISTPFEDVNLSVCYISIQKATKTSDVIKIIEKGLQELGLSLDKIIEVQLWKNYFPHFKDFKGYQALKDMQAENRTFLVGGIHQFEFIEAAASTSIQLIEAFFPDLTVRKKTKGDTLKNLWYWFKH